MLDAASVEALTRSLMLGTARQAVPVERAFGGMIEPADPAATLKALALVGQHSRFRRSSPTSTVAAEPLFSDGRATIAETARPLLISLFTARRGGVAADVVALAVADAMARKRVKIHPFDLPHLEDFVKTHCEQLGPGACAWVERHASRTTNDPQHYLLDETIDETSWMRARPAQKAAFIRGLRATDPARARELVEGSFQGEQAAVRVALLNALNVNLSPADLPFLESLAKDRAPSVRDAAADVLSRLPGTAQAAKRLEECLSRIKMTKGGLLRRRTVLRIDFPATVQEPQRTFWAIGTFGAIGLEEFAAALGLSADEIVTAAADDQILSGILAVQAARARRYDLVARLVRDDTANAWVIIDWSGDPDGLDPASAPAWSAAVVQPDVWKDMPHHLALESIYRKMRGPLAEPAARSILASRAWRSFIDHARQHEPPEAAASLAAIVALTPSSLRAALRAALAPLSPSLIARAQAALSLLDLIEAA
jgi:uncharacterized protein DUF5691